MKLMFNVRSLILFAFVRIFRCSYVVTASPIVTLRNSFVRNKSHAVYNDYCLKHMRCGSQTYKRVGGEETDHRLIQELAEKCPESTLAERVRFVTKHKDKAFEMLQSYIEWRNRCEMYNKKIETKDKIIQNELESPSTGSSNIFVDKEDWDNAVHVARQLEINSQTTDRRSEQENSDEEIPQCICMYQSDDSNSVKKYWLDKCNRRVIVYRPSLMDEKRMSLSTYASAIAVYIDSKLQRDSHERVTVLIDVRPGVGWGNVPVSQLLLSSFIRDISSALTSLLPERMTATILFPVPGSLRWIWNVAAKFMDPITAEKIHLISGQAVIDSEQPHDQLREHFYDDFLNLLENDRLGNFGSRQ